jgi:hypothetical protein
MNAQWIRLNARWICSADSMFVSLMSNECILPRELHIALWESRRHRRDSVKHVLLLQLLRPK